MATPSVDGLEVVDLEADDLPEAAGVPARGMRDNPMHVAGRAMRWIRALGARDPEEPHVHLGPLAVDAHLQGEGIGSRLLAEHPRRLDAAGEVGYLETDKPENVVFYERHGLEVVDRADVIGVASWFMRRSRRATGGAP